MNKEIEKAMVGTLISLPCRKHALGSSGRRFSSVLLARQGQRHWYPAKQIEDSVTILFASSCSIWFVSESEVLSYLLYFKQYCGTNIL